MVIGIWDMAIDNIQCVWSAFRLHGCTARCTEEIHGQMHTGRRSVAEWATCLHKGYRRCTRCTQNAARTHNKHASARQSTDSARETHGERTPGARYRLGGKGTGLKNISTLIRTPCTILHTTD